MFIFVVVVMLVFMVVSMLILMVVAMLIVVIFAQQRNIRRSHCAACCRGHCEQFQWLGQLGDGSVNQGAISVAFRRMLKANDVSARDFKFHCDRRTFESNVQRSVSVLVRVQLTGLGVRSASRKDRQAEGGREFERHRRLLSGGSQ
jgi:hypothetical protein